MGAITGNGSAISSNGKLRVWVLTYGLTSLYLIKWYYLFACWRVYGILRTFVPDPKHPLANKLFDMFGVNHGAERLWPIPWHVA